MTEPVPHVPQVIKDFPANSNARRAAEWLAGLAALRIIRGWQWLGKDPEDVDLFKVWVLSGELKVEVMTYNEVKWFASGAVTAIATR